MQQYVTDKQTIIKDGGERFQWEKYQADLEKKKRELNEDESKMVD